MEADGINVQVYNGGVAGFSSSQELLKPVHDVIPLRPDLVISYHGINDVGVRDVVARYPMANNYQEAIMKYLEKEEPPLLIPNTIHALKHLPWASRETRIKRAINYRPKVESEPADKWSGNVRLMNAAAVEFDIQYLNISQPALGVGSYGERTEEEKEMLKNVEGAEASDDIQLLHDFYNQARPDGNQMDYCEDFVDVFEGQSELYIDKMHVNDLGNHLVAQAAYDALLKRYPSLKQNLLQ